jgi:hypothetical protein
MKRKLILFIVISCFLGATFVTTVQADDPDYITYGQIMASFQASLGSLEIFYHDGAYHAAPALGDEGGRIVPWWDGAFYRYQDAHIIMVGFYFEAEGIQLAKFLTDQTVIKYFHQGPNDDALVELPVTVTAVSRRMIPGWVEPSDGTGWRVAYGTLFHQQELDLGDHRLVTEVYGFGNLVWYFDITFGIVMA